ncbi:ABC transporter permease [Rhizobium sp. Root149]|uniref:branched-chain amino acid ABC transporter permease n=1 Tax=Rhizobium sp. Root149 TaxID=1736473 RepID=UPI00071330E0|nr:branched-chain amino acid ABC transporter permease [Rhizobium sp. Root149]KQZ46660.1 ABC transporter permease [Rhizobium sp. Root149]
MDLQIAAILFQDGMGSGAIYAMLALGFVLVFTTTRIIFASYGDLIAYAALTLHALQQGRLPGTVALIAVLAFLAVAAECIALARRGEYRHMPRAVLIWLILPLLPAAISYLIAGAMLHPALQIALTIALVVPIGPLLYRIVFQPIETASTLTLLIVALVLHYLISGLALLFFGPEGIRTAAIIRGSFDLFGVMLQYQLLAVVSAAILIAAMLAVFFNQSLSGKALRATAFNRDGARLVGISTRRAGSISFMMAGIIASVVGILIGSSVTIYYDSGLMIGLKGFVGAVLGGFASYPLATLGSVLIGIVESYSSFFASTFKEIIVYLAIVPIILLRVFITPHSVEEEEEHA